MKLLALVKGPASIASAMLLTGARVSQLALLPQGQPDRMLRVRRI